MNENIQNDGAPQFKITLCCRSENLNLMNLLKIKFELRYISERSSMPSPIILKCLPDDFVFG